MHHGYSVGDWIRRRRLALDLSRAELARLAGCTVSMLKKIELDERRPSQQLAALLAERLAVPPEERTAFVQSARAERAADRLGPPTASSGSVGLRGWLPVPATPLLGRSADVAAVGTLLRRDDVRLLTLTGPGGVGKTRLALEIADGLLNAGCDHIHFVDLSVVTDPALVLPAIARRLGVAESPGSGHLDTLRTYLAGKQVLLVLDNLEHVIGGTPALAELLCAVPGLRVLATSRVILRLSREHEYAVPPLAVPRPLLHGQLVPSIEELSGVAAVQLFVARAQRSTPAFRLTTTNAAAVAAICTRLDGLPLAIELAATRTKLLPPAALLAALDRRLSLLVGGPRDMPARQQTLRAALDWSYSLLTPAEQTLLARLAVFVGGCTVEAIKAVCNADRDVGIETLDGVAALLDHSLLRRDPGLEVEPRFVMLETIHEYARERLEANGEAAQVRKRHAAYFLSLAERLEPALYGGPQTVPALNKLDAELGNLREALGWTVDHAAWEHELRIAAALDRFWFTRGYLREGRQWLEAGLAQAAVVPLRLRARTMLAISGLVRNLRDDAYTLATGRESLALFRQLGEPFYTVDALNRLAMACSTQQDFGQALVCYQEALKLARAHRFERFVGTILNNLGCLALEQRDYVQAGAWLEECVTILRGLGNRYGLAAALHTLGETALACNDRHRAFTLFRESLSLLVQLGDKLAIAGCLEGLANTLASDAPARSARLFGAAVAIREPIGVPRESIEHRYAARVGAELGEDAWHVAQAAGRAMTLEQAVAYALEPL